MHAGHPLLSVWNQQNAVVPVCKAVPLRESVKIVGSSCMCTWGCPAQREWEAVGHCNTSTQRSLPRSGSGKKQSNRAHCTALPTATLHSHTAQPCPPQKGKEALMHQAALPEPLLLATRHCLPVPALTRAALPKTPGTQTKAHRLREKAISSNS